MKYSSYEHYLVKKGEKLKALGEHIMTEGGILSYDENLWGSDEVITDYYSDCSEFRCTLINSADSLEELEEKRKNSIKKLEGVLYE
ncbi:MAG: hypothetical protein ACRCUS_08165 [Anaerovoracaceae bacterium]